MARRREVNNAVMTGGKAEERSVNTRTDLGHKPGVRFKKANDTSVNVVEASLPSSVKTVSKKMYLLKS
jgi:hypothetical protein